MFNKLYLLLWGRSYDTNGAGNLKKLVTWLYLTSHIPLFIPNIIWLLKTKLQINNINEEAIKMGVWTVVISLALIFSHRYSARKDPTMKKLWILILHCNLLYNYHFFFKNKIMEYIIKEFHFETMYIDMCYFFIHIIAFLVAVILSSKK